MGCESSNIINSNGVSNNDVMSIAVICRSAYGDLVIADSLLQYLLHQYPTAKITLIVDEKNSSLLPYLIHYHDAIILPAAGSKLKLLIRALKYRYIKDSYKKRFDLAVIAKASPSRTMNLFFYFLGAKYNFAYVDDNWHGRLINCRTLYDKQSSQRYHQAVKFLRLVDSSFVDIPQNLYPKIKVPSAFSSNVFSNNVKIAERQFVVDQIGQIAAERGALLLVSASNNRSYAYLGADLYSYVLNEVYKVKSFKVIISCLPKDIALAKEIAGKLVVVPRVICATADFDAFMFLLNLIDACFVGEGGIMHLAAALNKPQLALFGRAHDYVTCWRPLSGRAYYLYDEMDVKNIPRAIICNALIKVLELAGRIN